MRIKRRLFRVPAMTQDYAEEDKLEAVPGGIVGRVEVDNLDDADVISSLVVLDGETRIHPPGGWHAPVLDLDFECELTPSETPGHYHLKLERPMAWPDYEKLLRVLADVDILEQGYVNASIERQATFIAVRPWKGGDGE